MAQLTTTALVSGLVGGLVATIVMSVVMNVMGGGPPPTANLIARFAGGDPGEYAMPGMLLHLLYGTVAGGVLVALAVAVLDVTLIGDLGGALLWSVVWAILLMVVGAVGWVRGVIGMRPTGGMMMQFGVVHIVYGLVLGAWLGLGVLA